MKISLEICPDCADGRDEFEPDWKCPNCRQKDDANNMLTAKMVSEIADQYEEQVRLEKLYQEDKERKIKELEQLISSSKNKSIYKLLYKPEYGDYRQFVEDVAAELRRRNACC